IEHHGQALGAIDRRLDRAPCSVRGRLVDVGQNDARAELGERCCVLAPEQPTGPGDERGAPVQVEVLRQRTAHVLLTRFALPSLWKRAHPRNWPPSATMMAPVMNAARGEARKATTSAISSGVPKRASATSRASISPIASGAAARRFSQGPPCVRMLPGATALMRMPWAASGRARERTVAFKAALAPE